MNMTELLSAPIYGKLFNRELHDFIMNITGLSDKMIRPDYQFEPPIFTDDLDWCSFRCPKIEPLFGVFEKVSQDGFFRQEQEKVDFIVSFYGPNAFLNCRKFVSGMKLGDFWSVFQKKTGCRLISADIIEGVPDLLDGHWVMHKDVLGSFLRETTWKYSGINEVSSVVTEIQED